MLILTRKEGESVLIGDKVKVTIMTIKNRTVRVGVSAPKDCKVLRDELLLEGDSDAASRPSDDI